MRHLNAYISVDGALAEKAIGTFSADDVGTLDAQHALADAKAGLRASGFDSAAVKTRFGFVDTEVLSDDGKSVKEFGSLADLDAASPSKKKGK